MSFATTLSRMTAGSALAILGYRSAKNSQLGAFVAERLNIHQAENAVKLHGTTMALGGLALAHPRLAVPAATGIALSLIPTTFAGHQFWRHNNGAKRQGEWIHFAKNVSLIGAMSFVAVAQHELNKRR